MNDRLVRHLASAGVPELYPQGLEQRFPHVVKRIADAWESPPRTLAIFDDLLIDNRGNRQGFPPEVAAELLNLSSKYHDLTDGWRTQQAWRDTYVR